MKSSAVSLLSSALPYHAGHSFRNPKLPSAAPELIYNEVNSPSAFGLSDTWIPATAWLR